MNLLRKCNATVNPSATDNKHPGSVWSTCKTIMTKGARWLPRSFQNVRDKDGEKAPTPEGKGLHSWMCAMMRIAGADVVRQFGHDETSIDYVATFNQWCLTEEGGELEVVVFEAGGLLVGGTAEEVAEHVQSTWERAQAAILMLREELGDKAVELVPLRQGGMLLLKIESAMHDTCNTTNAVRPLLQERKGISGRQFHGAEELESFGPEKKKLYDCLCGNHTRNLPIDAHNRRFEKWLSVELGSHFAAAAVIAGSMAWLKKSGESLLRSTCKLIHDGCGVRARLPGAKIVFFGNLSFFGLRGGSSPTEATIRWREGSEPLCGAAGGP
jgi:hypothetical protein